MLGSGNLCVRRDWYFQETLLEKYQFRLTYKSGMEAQVAGTIKFSAAFELTAFEYSFELEGDSI